MSEKKTKETSRRAPDKESTAIRSILNTLNKLSDTARFRVMRYVENRLEEEAVARADAVTAAPAHPA